MSAEQPVPIAGRTRRQQVERLLFRLTMWPAGTALAAVVGVTLTPNSQLDIVPQTPNLKPAPKQPPGELQAKTSTEQVRDPLAPFYQDYRRLDHSLGMLAAGDQIEAACVATTLHFGKLYQFALNGGQAVAYAETAAFWNSSEHTAGEPRTYVDPTVPPCPLPKHSE